MSVPRPLFAVLGLAIAVAMAGQLPGVAADAGPPAPPGPGRGRILPKRVYQAARLTGAAPRIDGRLDEPCWSPGEWAGGFIQREPHEGRPGSQPTEFKLLYDDRYVYVAIRARDGELAAQPRLRGRRDEFTGDIVGVNFDSYFDKRTGFEFDLTSGGAKLDLILRNDGSVDLSWNAVWDGKVGTEAGAWVAEFRIPFSQLRYGTQPEQVWGLHCWRWINRLQEESDWQLLPMDSPGLVYSFGELRGIRDLPPSRRIELLPYAVARSVSREREPGNPYRRGTESDIEAGLDAKVGLTSNFTLDLTVNPDFGQVEADPSEVNLTTYETFFEEKRPFFLEGKAIFEYAVDTDAMFYSRRIGHAPAFDPPTDGFKRTPASTRILGAAKLSGKTPGGLSVGVVEAVTDREVADISEAGTERQADVEPLTSYTVARVQQDLDGGATLIGGMATVTARRLPTPALDFLPRTAYTGGADFLHHWNDRTYYLQLLLLGSRVEGSPAAVTALMRNPVHNYQRPDATHLGVEDGATHLDGTGGLVRVGKDNNGKWRYYAGVDWRSPGLELNDLGYLKTADVVRHSARLQYFDTSPGAVFRRRDVHLEEAGTFDWAGERLQQEIELHGEFTSNRKWAYWGEIDYSSDLRDTRVLRGGPALRVPGSMGVWIGGQTDGSKPRQFQLDAGHYVSFEGNSRYSEVIPRFTARLFNTLRFEAKVSYARDVEDLQYAGTAAVAGGSRYLMGRMDQQTVSATLRLDWNLSPELSLAYYGSPFVSTGRFTEFKLVTRPRAGRYEDRFERLGAAAVLDPAANRYRVGTGEGAYTFANPDFSWREFNSNLVLRWE